MRIFFKRQAARKSRSKRGRKKFLGACLSATLATAWAGTADSKDIHVTILPTVTMHSAWLVFHYSNASPDFLYLGTLSGNETNAFNYYNIPDTQFDPSNSGIPTGYEFIGAHVGEDPTGLAVGFPSDSPIQQGQSFSDAFPPVPGITFNEADLLVSITHNHYGDYLFDEFLSIYLSQLSTPYGVQGTIVNFTGASFGGTIDVDVVPEPASWILLVSAAGMSTVLARGRREL